MSQPVSAAENRRSIEWLSSIAAAHADRVCLIEHATGVQVTFGELDAQSRRLASVLRGSGMDRGARVVVSADGGLPLAVFYFACLAAGIVVVPLNPSSTRDEFEYVIRASEATCLVVDEAGAKATEGLSARRLTLAQLTDDAKKATPLVAYEGMSDLDDVLVVFTSGTTARPKGVVHRLFDLVENGRMFGAHVGLSPENRFLGLLPMTYLGGYYNLLLLPYVNGSSVVLTAPFNAASALHFWKPIIDSGINTLWLVPSILSVLLRTDRGDAGADYCRKNVRFVLCGTAPLPADLRQRFEQRYGVSLFENYGLSETLFLSANTPRVDKRDDVGEILPRIDIRIADRQGRPVPVGEEGEIQIKTPYLMRGYMTESNGLDLPLVDGYFPTGDLGRIHEGRLAISGRSKDLIIRGGVNISPASIEAVLAPHPSVAAVAVIGVPHDVMGEEIVAVVELNEGVTFERARIELAELAAASLSRLKQPSRFVSLPELPRTSSGKVQKAKIRTWLMESAQGITGGQPQVGVATSDIPKLHPSHVVNDTSEAMSIKYNTRVYELREKKEDVIVLSLGEAFFDIPLHRFDDLPFPEIYHYSHSRGIPELRTELERYFQSEYEVQFDPNREIIITAGSKIAIFMALLSVTNPGDEVLFHEPAWVSYTEQIRLCYGKPIGIPYDVEVFDFERFITKRTKCIIINNPNNPRGRLYTLPELAHLHSLARKHGLYVLSDEAYSDFLLDSKRFVSMANLDIKKSHTIVVNSISKNFGISGWRLGYVISNAELISQMLKLNQHLVTCPATILEYYIAKHFQEIIAVTKPQMRAVVEKRNRVAASLGDYGLTALPGDSTFYLFVSIGSTSLTSEQFCDELLDRYRVCVVPGIGYGDSCDRFVRVGIGTESEERIARGLRSMRELIDATSSTVTTKAS